MSSSRRLTEIRLEVPTAERLAQLVAASLPLDVRAGPPSRRFHRDTYFDTPDRELRRRGILCRIRTRSDDRRVLAVRFAGPEPQVFETRVAAVTPPDILGSAVEPARRLRAVVDPDRLAAQLDLTTERQVRRARRGRLPLPQFEIQYDTVTVRRGQRTGELHELRLRHAGWGATWGGLPLPVLAQALQDAYGLRPALLNEMEQAELLLEALESEGLAEVVQRGREVTVMAVEHGRVALGRGQGDLRLPFQVGSGERACREVMRQAFGSAEGQVIQLGVVPATDTRPTIEVWLARRLPRDFVAAHGGFEWFAPGELVARVGSPVLRDPKTLAALTVAARSDLLPEWVPSHDGEREHADAGEELDRASRKTLAALRVPILPDEALDTANPVPDHFFNPELSLLEFNSRVLALAEDPGVPLLARVRFLSIFSTNMDEFFRVKVAGLKRQVHKGATDATPDGLHPQEALEAIAVRVRAMVARQYACFRRLATHDLAAHDIRLYTWRDLTEAQQTELRRYFDEQVFSLLTPKAITLAPGHPFPYIDELQLSLAVTIRDERSGSLHFAHLKVPDALPRFVQLPGTRAFLPIEEVVRANIQSLYPGRTVEAVHPFRLTREGDLDLDELAAANFEQAIEEEVRRRPTAPVVRMEIERAMPDTIRGLLQRELRFEEGDHAGALSDADVYAADGPVDLGALGEIASLDVPELHYAPFEPAAPFPRDCPVRAVLEERDVLVHHPYDTFSGTLERFIVEAADDPEVRAIKLTLYRPGGPSAIGDALKRAASAGKDVSVFVELKARFDEERNLVWARQLEKAGIHVVTGLVRLKAHAKITLIVRRANGRLRRYAHIGSGNYNPESGRQYSDLGLFTADEALTSDLNTLFNELTGSSAAPRAEFRRLLVSPTNLLTRLLELIRRERAHAAAGRGGQIRAKLNALNDQEVIGALYQASQAGVNIDLVVRGICTLRPGVPGLSERIRVVSSVGRFLEHGRIYAFGNGGQPEYFIGSADWRPRNLRRRVEVVTPVSDPAATAYLDRMLELEIDDPQAYELQPDGSYVRVTPPTGVEAQSAQEAYMAMRRERR